MIKAVVFDLDHTLFDRHATLRKIAPEFRRSFEVPDSVSDSEIADRWIYADDHFIYDGWEYIFSYLVESGVFKTAPAFAQYRSFVYKNFERVAVPFEGTAPMLRELRKSGYKTGLITNGNHSLQYKKLKLLGLTAAFDEIIVSGDVMTDKPDREIFRMMADRLGVKTGEMIYVGDNPKNDIGGAARAGCRTVWMKSTGVWQYSETVPDESVSRVEDIPAAVEKISRRAALSDK